MRPIYRYPMVGKVFAMPCMVVTCPNPATHLYATKRRPHFFCGEHWFDGLHELTSFWERGTTSSTRRTDSGTPTAKPE